MNLVVAVMVNQLQIREVVFALASPIWAMPKAHQKIKESIRCDASGINEYYHLALASPGGDRRKIIKELRTRMLANVSV